jgi:hypothetical protein
MKKILSFLAILFLVTTPLIAGAASMTEKCTISRTIDANGLTCPTGETLFSREESGNTPAGSLCCLLNSIYNVVDWIFIILVALAGIFIITGAMKIIMAGGDSTKVDDGRKAIMYAAIGLAVAFLAKAIPSIIIAIVK